MNTAPIEGHHFGGNWSEDIMFPVSVPIQALKEITYLKDDVIALPGSCSIYRHECARMRVRHWHHHHTVGSGNVCPPNTEILAAMELFEGPNDEVYIPVQKKRLELFKFVWDRLGITPQQYFLAGIGYLLWSERLLILKSKEESPFAKFDRVLKEDLEREKREARKVQTLDSLVIEFGSQIDLKAIHELAEIRGVKPIPMIRNTIQRFLREALEKERPTKIKA